MKTHWLYNWYFWTKSVIVSYRIGKRPWQASIPVLHSWVNGSPQDEWNFWQRWMKEHGRMKDEWIFVAKFSHPLVLVFLPNTYQQTWIKLRTSSILTLQLQQSGTYHFRKTLIWRNQLPQCSHPPHWTRHRPYVKPRGPGGNAPHKFLKYMVILFFEKPSRKQKYCCSPKVNQLAPQTFWAGYAIAINDALRIVTGSLRLTPAGNLPILVGIKPAELRRKWDNKITTLTRGNIAVACLWYLVLLPVWYWFQHLTRVYT